ncbi:MAG: hypothetical protein ACXVBW_10290, partial [Bdellovibrionota bacterium]
MKTTSPHLVWILMIIAGLFGATPRAMADDRLSAENGVFIRIIKDSLVHGPSAKRYEDNHNSHGLTTLYSQNWGELELWIYSPTAKRYEHSRSYPLCMYSGYPGTKHREGDYQSPEGFYSIHRDDLNPHSDYLLSMDIGYPNKYYRIHRYTGGDIKI